MSIIALYHIATYHIAQDHAAPMCEIIPYFRAWCYPANSHSAAPNQTKLHLVAPHTIPASPEQHTLYVTLSSSLSSTIICPPQNPLAVLVLMFELLLCDINIRILLKPFPGFMFGTTWSMDVSNTSLQTVIELQLICTQVDLEYLDSLSVNQNVLDHRCRARSQASIQKTSLLVWGALLGSLSTSLYYISLGFGNIRL